MSEDSFLTKTNAAFLALTLAFVAGAWSLRAAQRPAEIAPDYTVTTTQSAGAVAALTAEVPVVVNVNTASEEELQALPGIGPVKAQTIIDYREEHGNFSCAEDLLNVSGIGEATLEKIRDDITWEVTP